MKTTTITWEGMKHTIDWTAFTTGVAYALGWVGSHILGILSGVWLSMQIYTWIKNKKWKREVK